MVRDRLEWIYKPERDEDRFRYIRITDKERGCNKNGLFNCPNCGIICFTGSSHCPNCNLELH